MRNHIEGGFSGDDSRRSNAVQDAGRPDGYIVPRETEAAR